MIPRISHIEAKEKYTILVSFEDRTSGLVDLSHLAGKGVFKFWDKNDNFKQVHINEESGAVTWNDYIDIDPLQLYAQLKNTPIENFIRASYAQNQ